jgi:hypothetical protein
MKSDSRHHAPRPPAGQTLAATRRGLGSPHATGSWRPRSPSSSAAGARSGTVTVTPPAPGDRVAVAGSSGHRGSPRLTGLVQDT